MRKEKVTVYLDPELKGDIKDLYKAAGFETQAAFVRAMLRHGIALAKESLKK